MTKVYLFDWGNTLMVDFPDVTGKMCDWPVVAAVTGAEEALISISKNHKIYIATDANDSTEHDIQLAFERVGLSSYISGYFCKANVGLSKGSPEFYQTIVNMLGLQPGQVAMVGDSIKNDVAPAIQAGLEAIWFNPYVQSQPRHECLKQVEDLRELCI
jgi:FMN hydrolase / 5-amino-6-(5-phospho-D-ribitylamino)uracil phosphatase